MKAKLFLLINGLLILSSINANAFLQAVDSVGLQNAHRRDSINNINIHGTVPAKTNISNINSKSQYRPKPGKKDSTNLRK